MDIFANIVPILIASFSLSIPLILAALGGTFSVRGGVMALGLESMMMVGAFTATLGSYLTQSAWIGILCGILGGVVLGLMHGILCIRYKVNQVISGIGLNLLATAFTTLLMQMIWGTKGNSPQVADIGGTFSEVVGKIPVIGSFLSQISILGYISVICAFAGSFLLFKTVYGLRLRIVGENPKVAASMGLNVRKIKYSGVLICGALAGLGGAYLSIDHLNMYVRDMTAGRGYIAVVIAILARYSPVKVIYAALLFGFFDALQIYMQNSVIPPQIIQMLPYVATLLVLTFAVKHIRPPAGVGKHEDD